MRRYQKRQAIDKTAYASQALILLFVHRFVDCIAISVAFWVNDSERQSNFGIGKNDTLHAVLRGSTDHRSPLAEVSVQLGTCPPQRPDPRAEEPRKR